MCLYCTWLCVRQAGKQQASRQQRKKKKKFTKQKKISQILLLSSLIHSSYVNEWLCVYIAVVICCKFQHSWIFFLCTHIAILENDDDAQKQLQSRAAITTLEKGERSYRCCWWDDNDDDEDIYLAVTQIPLIYL